MTGRSTTEAVRALHAEIRHVQLRDGFRDSTAEARSRRRQRRAVDWTECWHNWAKSITEAG